MFKRFSGSSTGKKMGSGISEHLDPRESADPNVVAEESQKAPAFTYQEFCPNPPIVESDSSSPQKQAETDPEQQVVNLNSIWIKLDEKFEKLEHVKPVEHSEWKIVRIFVSSTFKDMFTEREQLMKETFQKLRQFCEKRKIRLIECDLRWGVPKGEESWVSIKVCLEEIERCKEANTFPFFLNMTSERAGWIPKTKELTNDIKQRFKWVEGLSVTEMEVVNAAYRKENPNALFMVREMDLLLETAMRENPTNKNKKEAYLEDSESKRISTLKQKIEDKYKQTEDSSRVHKYKLNGTISCSCTNRKISPGETYTVCSNDCEDRFEFKLDDAFGETVKTFFEKRISEMYHPVYTEKEEESIYQQHIDFCNFRGTMPLVGRSVIMNKLEYYCNSGDTPHHQFPLFLLGSSGVGKSSVMAHVAYKINKKIKEKGLDSKIICHFVGAVKRSTSLLKLLQRLLEELGETEVPPLLEDAVALTKNWLSAKKLDTKVVIIIDAINQLDSNNLVWLPPKLGPNIKCVLSTTDLNEQTYLMSNDDEGNPVKCVNVVKVEELTSVSDKCTLVDDYFKDYGKTLHRHQLAELVSKPEAGNPLWLVIACEELRLFGSFRELTKFIQDLPNTTEELLHTVLDRHEKELNEMEPKLGHLLKATIGLIKASRMGLYEEELIGIMGDEDLLMPPEHTEDSDSTNKFTTKLPYVKWASVFGKLHHFFKPFGAAGDGRMDFYHKAMSKVASERPKGEEKVRKQSQIWWHRKLADFFHQGKATLERTVEELPYQLVILNEKDRLQQYLSQWEVFDALYHPQHSRILLNYWREIDGSYEVMGKCYLKLFDQNTDREDMARLIKVGHILIQAGLYVEATQLESRMAKNTEIDDRMEIHRIIAVAFKEKTRLPETQKGIDDKDVEMCIKHLNTALGLSRQNTNHDLKSEGIMLKDKAFILKIQHDRLRYHHMKGSDKYNVPLKEARSVIDEAIGIAKKRNLEGFLAQAYLVKGIIQRDDKDYDGYDYKEAVEISLKVYGDSHQLTGEIYCSKANFLHDRGFKKNAAKSPNEDFYKAYDLYRNGLDIYMEVYGLNHAKTKKLVNKLTDGVKYKGIYKKICQERKDHIYRKFLA